MTHGQKKKTSDSRRSSLTLRVSARSKHVGVSLHTMDIHKKKMMWCHYISGREDNFYKKSKEQHQTEP